MFLVLTIKDLTRADSLNLVILCRSLMNFAVSYVVLSPSIQCTIVFIMAGLYAYLAAIVLFQT